MCVLITNFCVKSKIVMFATTSMYDLTSKVNGKKSAYEPSGSSGQSLSRFQ